MFNGFVLMRQNLNVNISKRNVFFSGVIIRIVDVYSIIIIIIRQYRGRKRMKGGVVALV